MSQKQTSLSKIMREKARGIRALGRDTWGDFWCEDAAVAIEELAEALRASVEYMQAARTETSEPYPLEKCEAALTAYGKPVQGR